MSFLVAPRNTRLPSCRRFIIGAALGLLLLTGGCSALRIGYSQAPDLVYWWMDAYIDFTSEQTPRVREALVQWFAWHRKTQLPDYADQLARAQKEVLADTSAQRVCEWQDELIKRAHTAFDRAEPAVVDVLLSVSPDQVRHLEKRYAKNNDEFRDDYLQSDLRERADKTLDRTLERAEMLYGRFDDGQRARIADWLARSPFDPELWLAERRQRQQETLRMLRDLGPDNGAGREQATRALREYVEHLERSPRENYRRYSAKLKEFNCQFAAALHNGTTAAQRRIAAKKLAGWEGDLRALVAQGAAAEMRARPAPGMR